MYHGGNTSVVEANPNLYVHNVPKDSNEEELRHLFGQFGNVERVRLKVNQKVGPHAVYAFVTFSTTEDAQRALNKLQGSDVRGRALRIEFQRTTGAGMGGGYYGTWADGGMATAATATSAGSMSPPSSELRTPNLSLRSTAPPADHIFGTAPSARDTTQNAMWGNTGGGASSIVNGTSTFQGSGWSTAPTRPAPSTDSSSPAADMPPFKRGRFHSPSTRRPRSPTRSANVVAPDHANATEQTLAIWSQLKELVTHSHPHAVGLVETLGEMLRPDVSAPVHPSPNPASTSAPVKPNVVHPAMGGALERWPMTDLNSSQRVMIRDGTLTLNQDNNRYMVRLSPVLAPLKPAMFARRGQIDRMDAGVMKQQPAPRASIPAPVEQQHPPMSSSSTSSTPRIGFSSQPPYGMPQPYTVTQPVLQPAPQPIVNKQPTFEAPKPVVVPATPTQQPAATPQATDESFWLSQLAVMPLTNARQREVVWRGMLARNEKKKVAVTMKRLAGYIENHLPDTMGMVNISHRSSLEEMYKKKIGAIGLLEPETPESLRAFQEYITYFKEKHRAGVARLDGSEYQMVYLLPIGLANLGEHVTSNLPTSGDYLLAVVGRQCASQKEGEQTGNQLNATGEEEVAQPVVEQQQGASPAAMSEPVQPTSPSSPASEQATSASR
eukprot:Blabericola_migrator_1__4451@NODE_2382_length_2849_cov_138_772466_g1492_i0_p1_GENE_NODE_2382_length_2849_cov_138_772466_g1492_i0NODE_2382_length_2849_cov_138_772466_g1492_i0_p1_ORF_typecomplete_len664_score102_09RRM_1/PF00076_22/6_5e20SPOC/PF07744_13/1_1e13RRM_5/PF13893_6/6_9e13Limkainb1/PF11608_8/1_3e07RRM_Rrp7/PF17799_1/4_5e05RRM_7/PF16367_5/4_7e05RRM_8/PF11835_8/0_00049RRM_occluded/PF16842_5/0_0014RRM_3/PF08777_11/0_0013Nup35_RRM_2/PF14605_6/0_0018RL/PF17797_1/0_0022PHM7_cyt/PF14703_6/36PHM7_